MHDGSRLRGLPILGIALAGMVLGHLLTYLIVFPGQDHRHLVLQGTGHTYLPAFALVALLLAMGGAITILARAWTTSERSSKVTFASLVVTLAVVQVSAFVGQEILERMVAGAPLGDLASGPLLAFGVTAQVVMAIVGSMVGACLDLISDRVAVVAASDRVRVWRPDPLVPVCAAPEMSPNADVLDGRRGRAPPSI